MSEYQLITIKKIIINRDTMNIMHVDYHQSLTCMTTVIVLVHTHNDSRSIETKCMMQYDYESRPHVMIVVHTQQ
jgi:hypothetical protein